MPKKCRVLGALVMLLASAAAGQDPKAILNAAAKAMGIEDIGSVSYTGSGASYELGQAFGPTSPWPKFNVTSYTRTIDFDAGLSRERMVRTQGENPPRGGGPQPLLAEQTQNIVASVKQPWTSQYRIWITPAGFILAALRSETILKTVPAGGKTSNVVSFTAERHKYSGYFDDHNLLTKVETSIENPVLGDMPVEATFQGYKDFEGLLFPSGIVEKQGGYPTLELTVSDALRNVIPRIAPPRPAPPERIVVDETLIAPGVYYFTGGTHHSVVVEFDTYVAVIEAPLGEARSAAVISEVKKLFTTKPIRYIINTHQHFDSAAGLRAYAAQGVTAITYQSNKAYYDKVFALPWTLAPDELAKSKKKAVIEPVAEKRVLTDGSRTLELYHLQSSGHSDSMLIAYLPKDKVVIEADLYIAPIAATLASGIVPGQQGAAPPKPEALNPYTVSLVENLDRLKLDYDTVVGLQGRSATKTELLRAAGKGN